MNQRITNQLHQLSTIGEIAQASLSANVAVSLSSIVSVSPAVTHFQVMTTSEASYRSDGVSGGVFPMHESEPVIFTVRDFTKTYVVADSDCTIYIQALGE